MLGLGRRRAQAFTSEEVAFLTQVANQVAIAVDNALAYGQITALKDQLAQEKLYLEDEIRSERPLRTSWDTAPPCATCSSK